MRKTILAALMASVLGAAGYLIAEQKPKPAKAPDFTLTSFDDKKIALADYKGKIVVLAWFNYECPFIQYHYDKATMNDIAAKYQAKNVAFLAINSTGHQDQAATKEFAEKFKVTYPILDDGAGAVGKAYGALTTPHMFIIDAEGYIVYNGAIDNAPQGKTPEGAAYVNYVEKALDELIAGKPISVASTKPYGCPVKYGK